HRRPRQLRPDRPPPAGRRRPRPERPPVRALQHAPAPELLGAGHRRAGAGRPGAVRPGPAERDDRGRPARGRAAAADRPRAPPPARAGRVPRRGPAPDRRHPRRRPPAARRRRRRRPGRGGGRRADRRHRADPLLRVARRGRDPGRARRRRGAAGDRLEPPPGRALDDRAPHPRLHRARRPGPPAGGPQRQPPAGLPRRRRHDAHRRRPAGRRRGRRHQLRQHDHLHLRGAAVAGGRRRPRDRLAHRGLRRRPGRAHRADAHRAGDDRPHHPHPGDDRHPQPLHHRGPPAVRRGRRPRRRAGPGVPRRPRADHPVPRAHLRDAVDRDPGRQRRRAAPLRRAEQRRVRRDRHRRRPAPAGRDDRAAHRPARRRRCRVARQPAHRAGDPAAPGPHRRHPARRGGADHPPRLAARSFRLAGEARLYRRDRAAVIDELLGRPHDGSVTWARSSARLTGDVHTAAAAFDGDPGTAWTTVRAEPVGQWVEVVLTEPVTVDRLPVTLLADGYHSVPTELEVWVDGEVVGRVPVPPVEDGDRQGATAEVELELPEPVTGSRVRLRVTQVREVLTNDWVSDREVAQPVAIAEIGLPADPVPALPEVIDTGCRTDLVAIDGEPVPVRITGRTADALAGHALPLTTCDDAPVALSGGDHEIEPTAGEETGLDIDQLVLRSAAGGEASPAGAGTLVAEAVAADGGRPREGGGPVTPGPTVDVLDQDHDRLTVRVTGATPDEPFWLVLGQSHNLGWTASVRDGEELGEPELVDGLANGWRITPRAESLEGELRFTPQQRVDVALAVSAGSAALCLLLLLRRPRPLVHAPSSLAEPYSRVLAFHYEGALPTLRQAIVTGIGVGVLGYVLAGPLVGLVVGVAAGIGCRHETFRRYL